MKTLIIYSSLTGNTKKVCEKAYQLLNGEKEIVSLEKVYEYNLNEFENIIIGCWIDKATANGDMRKFVSKLSGKNLYFITTLAAKLDSTHAEKCKRNMVTLCSKNNNFIDGVLARGRVSDDLQAKMDKFPLNVIHKFVPNMKEIVLDADSHPNEEDFLIIENFIERNF